MKRFLYKLRVFLTNTPLFDVSVRISDGFLPNMEGLAHGVEYSVGEEMARLTLILKERYMAPDAGHVTCVLRRSKRRWPMRAAWLKTIHSSYVRRNFPSIT